MPERPWTWEFPYTIFGASFNLPPLDRIAEVNEALRSLVLGGFVVGASLVELHRALESATEGCVSVAELAEVDHREEVYEACWSASYDLLVVKQFEERLLTRDAGPPATWRHFGDQLGSVLCFLLRSADPLDSPEIITPFIDLGRRLLPPVHINPVADLIPRSSVRRSLVQIWETSKKLISAIDQLDRLVTENLEKDIAAEPYIVLDDERRVVVFLGADIPFKDFEMANASGGLAMLRVLKDQPGRPLKSSELVERAGLGIEPNGASAYLSRFRIVIRKTETQWPDIARSDPLQRMANCAFIVADRMAKKLARDITDTWYKLDLSAKYVRHVEPRKV
jgi:hypothetical protein